MKKLWAALLVGHLFLFCSLQAEKCLQGSEKKCKTASCFVDLLQSPKILRNASVKKITIPCETDFPQEGSNVLDVFAKGCKKERNNHHLHLRGKFSKIAGIYNKVIVVPGQSYCITAIGKVKNPHSSVKIYLHQKGETVSSTESLTNDFRIVTLNFVANQSCVNIALGTKQDANFEVQKFTLAACEPCSFSPLNILLVNDDGFSFIGIQTLKTVFEAAGHNVFLIAPSSEIDGTSSAVNLPTTTPLPQFALVQQVSSNEWKVSIVNSPHLTAPVVGPAFPVTALGQAPLVLPAGTTIDLIISGINAEALNTGPIANLSGTVGVARVAVTDVNAQMPPTPAIAVSSDNNLNPTFVNQVAEFVLDLVTQLQCSTFAKKTGKLLPPNTALNVNYPNRSPSDIQGVKITRQGIVSNGTSGTSFAGVPVGANVVPIPPAIPPLGPTFISAVELAPLPKALQTDIPDSDTLAVQQGFISITPITGDLTAPSCSTRDIIDTMTQLSFPAFGTYLPDNTKIRFCPCKKS